MAGGLLLTDLICSGTTTDNILFWINSKKEINKKRLIFTEKASSSWIICSFWMGKKSGHGCDPEDCDPWLWSSGLCALLLYADATVQPMRKQGGRGLLVVKCAICGSWTKQALSLKATQFSFWGHTLPIPFSLKDRISGSWDCWHQRCMQSQMARCCSRCIIVDKKGRLSLCVWGGDVV